MFTRKEEIQWICPQCGSTETSEIYTYVSAAEEPQCTQKILDTSLFRMKCRKCGRTEYNTGPLFYADENRKTFFAMGEHPDAEAMLANHISLGYTARKVPEIVDLCEKILIDQDGLDDRIVEIMKAANAVILKGQAYDQMLYAPDEDTVYFELIKDAASLGRIPFLQAMYDDLNERFKEDLENEADETEINAEWAVHFFAAHYHPAE
jgi:predicted nucleic-acid-binding Zn-ribbon protein